MTGVHGDVFVEEVEEIRVELFAVEAFEKGGEVDFEGMMVFGDLLVPDLYIFEYLLHNIGEIDVLENGFYFLYA